MVRRTDRSAMTIAVDFGCKATKQTNIALDKRFFEHKIVNIFLPFTFYVCFGCSKAILIETVLLSTHNICFGLEIRKLIFWYTL